MVTKSTQIAQYYTSAIKWGIKLLFSVIVDNKTHETTGCSKKVLGCSVQSEVRALLGA